MSFIKFEYQKNKYKRIVDLYVNKKLLNKYIVNKLGIKECNLVYNFVSKSYQIKINKEFKQHNYNTDILTFNYTQIGCELTGEVYISLKQISENKNFFKTTIEEEINRVIIHGFLHLIGYNDETKKDKNIMTKQENKFLKYLNDRRSTWNTRFYHY